MILAKNDQSGGSHALPEKTFSQEKYIPKIWVPFLKRLISLNTTGLYI